jgi:hypothetical protein
MVQWRNETGILSPKDGTSPKLGSGSIKPSSFKPLTLQVFFRAEVVGFSSADRPAMGTGKRRSALTPAPSFPNGPNLPNTDVFDDLFIDCLGGADSSNRRVTSADHPLVVMPDE